MNFGIIKKIKRGGYCMDNNQTDIFGGVTPFQTMEPKKEETSYETSVTNSPVSMEAEVIDIPEETVERPVASFNEMPFVGVNQQESVEPEKKDAIVSTPIMQSLEEPNTNMQQVEKPVDENSGLKFLLILGIIFMITIILLPFIP